MRWDYVSLTALTSLVCLSSNRRAGKTLAHTGRGVHLALLALLNVSPITILTPRRDCTARRGRGEFCQTTRAARSKCALARTVRRQEHDVRRRPRHGRTGSASSAAASEGSTSRCSTGQQELVVLRRVDPEQRQERHRDIPPAPPQVDDVHRQQRQADRFSSSTAMFRRKPSSTGTRARAWTRWSSPRPSPT